MLLVHKDRGSLAAPVTATVYEGRVGRIHTPNDALQYSSGPEHRDLAELVNIVDQLAGLPIYLGHPDVFPSVLSSQKIVGRIISGRLDSDTAVAAMAINGQEALDAIAAGTHELSLGYTCKLDNDRYQRGIKVDHLAIVERGRCGTECALRSDEVTMPNKDEVEEDAKLKAKERHALPEGSFGVPETEQLPMPDESHVRNAMARFGQTHFQSAAQKKSAYHRILAKAKEFGIESEGFQKEWSSKLDIENERACECPPNADPKMPCNCMLDKKDVKDDPCKNDAMLHNSGDMDELQAKLDAALAEIDVLKSHLEETTKKVADAEAAKIQAEIDAANAKKDSESEKLRADDAVKYLEIEKMKAVQAHGKTLAEKARKDAEVAYQATLNDRVNERVALITSVSTIGITTENGDPIDLTRMSVRDIKAATIKFIDGEDVPAAKEDAYVDGVFSGALKRHARAVASRTDVRQSLNQMRKEPPPVLTGVEAERAAKTAMRNTISKAWVTPVK